MFMNLNLSTDRSSWINYLSKLPQKRCTYNPLQWLNQRRLFNTPTDKNFPSMDEFIQVHSFVMFLVSRVCAECCCSMEFRCFHERVLLKIECISSETKTKSLLVKKKWKILEWIQRVWVFQMDSFGIRIYSPKLTFSALINEVDNSPN